MTRRFVALLLCFVLAVLLMVPAVSAEEAKEESKVVRVGWYETPFNHKDQFGRRTGYAYVYQRKIAAYTGWKYEYVEGTWSELLQMLQDGRIAESGTHRELMQAGGAYFTLFSTQAKRYLETEGEETADAQEAPVPSGLPAARPVRRP